MILDAIKGDPKPAVVQPAGNENPVVENKNVHEDPSPTSTDNNDALQLENDNLKLQLTNQALRQQIDNLRNGSPGSS